MAPKLVKPYQAMSPKRKRENESAVACHHKSFRRAFSVFVVVYYCCCCCCSCCCFFHYCCRCCCYYVVICIAAAAITAARHTFNAPKTASAEAKVDSARLQRICFWNYFEQRYREIPKTCMLTHSHRCIHIRKHMDQVVSRKFIPWHTKSSGLGALCWISDIGKKFYTYLWIEFVSLWHVLTALRILHSRLQNSEMNMLWLLQIYPVKITIFSIEFLNTTQLRTGTLFP